MALSATWTCVSINHDLFTTTYQWWIYLYKELVTFWNFKYVLWVMHLSLCFIWGSKWALFPLWELFSLSIYVYVDETHTILAFFARIIVLHLSVVNCYHSGYVAKCQIITRTTNYWKVILKTSQSFFVWINFALKESHLSDSIVSCWLFSLDSCGNSNSL